MPTRTRRSSIGGLAQRFGHGCIQLKHIAERVDNAVLLATVEGSLAVAPLATLLGVTTTGCSGCALRVARGAEAALMASCVEVDGVKVAVVKKDPNAKMLKVPERPP